MTKLLQIILAGPDKIVACLIRRDTGFSTSTISRIKNMKTNIFSFLIILLLSTVSCNSREERSVQKFSQMTPSPEVRTAPAQIEEAPLAASNVDAMLTDDLLNSSDRYKLVVSRQPIQTKQTISPSSQSRNRMVINTGTVNCEVANYEEALAQIQKIATQYGGYLVSSNTQVSTEDVKSGSVTLRIDARNFDAALQALKQLAKKVKSESVQGNDVTEEFYDLTARLENKRKAEKRYREILASAKTTKEILEVEQVLTNVREEIERMEGRKRFLEDQVSLSTINVNLHEPYPLVASGQYGFLAKMRQGVENGIAGFSEVLSAGIAFLISGVPIFILLFFLIWSIRRYRRKVKATQLAKATMAEKRE